MKRFFNSLFFPLFLLTVGYVSATITTLADTNEEYQNSISISIEQLCKTWISFESTSIEPMMRHHETTSINIEYLDTISFFKDGTFFRTNKLIKRNGLWEVINDTTVSCNITSPVSKSVSVHLLSDSILTLTTYWGKEGEHNVVKYRRSSICITK